MMTVLPLLQILLLTVGGIKSGATNSNSTQPIDRQALVSRHNLVLTKFDRENPVQVGNGEFAFGLDITGLQTFIPFNTMSHWGWNSSPLPPGTKISDFQGQIWDTHGRPVQYPVEDPQHPEISAWLAGNPHRINLGRIGMILKKKDGSVATQADVQNPIQKLDLWTGVVTSHFEIEGEPVTVITACHPSLDEVAAKVDSPLVRDGRLQIFLDVPGNDPQQFANFVGDWGHPSHLVKLPSIGINRADFEHKVDDADYRITLSWDGEANLSQTATSIEGEHGVILQPNSKSHSLSFVCAFSPNPIPKKFPGAKAVFVASRKMWPAYWKSGGAIDLSESTDPRWMELERRVVLSQYLMKVNEAGSYPPQESGLVNNGWFGRWHMEMYWWHAAHWALWNRFPELKNSLEIYRKILPGAKLLAKKEGYLGARWPKCIGPNDREWPHDIHAFLIWQQPHPLFFAELDYRAHPTTTTLKKWQPIVEATADFLASYAFYDKQKGEYVLGPPLHLVSENTNPATTENPTFELGYWRFGLRISQEWRKRMGLPENKTWAKVQAHLAPLPTEDGVYVLQEGIKDMWTKWNFEHPALIGVYGWLPGDGVDKTTMKRTLDKIELRWNFDRTWGWDYPMLAMCAARLGEPEAAINFLLTDKPGFQFDIHGYATGGPNPYFPSNGGLLYAIAMMAAGWDGAPKSLAPGFPKNGKWKIRYEGLSPAP